MCFVCWSVYSIGLSASNDKNGTNVIIRVYADQIYLFIYLGIGFVEVPGLFLYLRTIIRPYLNSAAITDSHLNQSDILETFVPNLETTSNF